MCLSTCRRQWPAEVCWGEVTLATTHTLKPDRCSTSFLLCFPKTNTQCLLVDNRAEHISQFSLLLIERDSLLLYFFSFSTHAFLHSKANRRRRRKETMSSVWSNSLQESQQWVSKGKEDGWEVGCSCSCQQRAKFAVAKWMRWKRRNIHKVRRGWWFEWECACSHVIAHSEWLPLSVRICICRKSWGRERAGKLVLAPMHFCPFINNEKMFSLSHLLKAAAAMANMYFYLHLLPLLLPSSFSSSFQLGVIDIYIFGKNTKFWLLLVLLSTVLPVVVHYSRLIE